MPKCPSCNTEYDNPNGICPNCSSSSEAEFKYDKEAFLMSVPDDMEANIIESLLQSYDIPLLKKYRKSGGYMKIYMGMSNFGIDLYVPSRLLEKAKELTKDQVYDEVVEAEEDMTKLEDDYNRKRRVRTWILLLLFFIPGIAGALISFVYLIMRFIVG